MSVSNAITGLIVMLIGIFLHFSDKPTHEELGGFLIFSVIISFIISLIF